MIALNTPVVIVTTVHAPVAIISSTFLLVVGVAFFIYNLRRYRRTRDSTWAVLSVAAALIIALSAASLIVYGLRH
jgi:uncharacterized membrane protein